MSNPEISIDVLSKQSNSTSPILNDPFLNHLNEQIEQKMIGLHNKESIQTLAENTEIDIYNSKPVLGLADLVSATRPAMDIIANKIDPVEHPIVRTIAKVAVMETDGLDGMVARAKGGKYASKMGDIVDPIADHVSAYINFRDAEKRGAIRKGLATIMGVRDALVDGTRILHRLLGTELGQMNAQRMKSERNVKKTKRQKIEDSAFLLAKTSVGILAPKYPKAANVMAHLSVLYSLKRGFDFFNNPGHLELLSMVKDRISKLISSNSRNAK